jgi:protein-S-isoprenylcysteine O-methyltransferase Ste14
MRIRALVGAGDRVVLAALPFAVAGIVADVVWPGVFRIGSESVCLVVGLVVLAVGIPLWALSVAQILVNVPRGRLVTTGPYALMLHPLYTSVSLLVIPGLSLALDTWVGFAIGAALYASSRAFAGREERQLASEFPAEYPAYRAKVLLPWL